MHYPTTYPLIIWCKLYTQKYRTITILYFFLKTTQITPFVFSWVCFLVEREGLSSTEEMGVGAWGHGCSLVTVFKLRDLMNSLLLSKSPAPLCDRNKGPGKSCSPWEWRAPSWPFCWELDQDENWTSPVGWLQPLPLKQRGGEAAWADRLCEGQFQNAPEQVPYRSMIRALSTSCSVEAVFSPCLSV